MVETGFRAIDSINQVRGVYGKTGGIYGKVIVK